MLSAASDYFAAMFTSPVLEATQEEVALRDMDSDALLTLVNYCYTGEPPYSLITFPLTNTSPMMLFFQQKTPYQILDASCSRNYFCVRNKYMLNVVSCFSYFHNCIIFIFRQFYFTRHFYVIYTPLKFSDLNM